ncbi:MAG: hypothetical protein KGI60_00080 [Patescibacteria group bacterium]|nr:hypothetical protein [Patescibacteria group bacterium]
MSDRKWALLIVGKSFAMIFLLLGIVALAGHYQGRARTRRVHMVVSLREPWDDAVSWDREKGTQRKYRNPSSDPMGELIMGDSRTYYGMPDVRTYFRFHVGFPRDARVENAYLLLRCSASGQTQPKLSIAMIERDSFRLNHVPWSLPLSRIRVGWKYDTADWKWVKYGAYRTPDLATLIQNHIERHPDSQMIGFVIINRPENHDAFKGIWSFDDKPGYAAKLIVVYSAP